MLGESYERASEIDPCGLDPEAKTIACSCNCQLACRYDMHVCQAGLPERLTLSHAAR
jgi:hypothetical protein